MTATRPRLGPTFTVGAALLVLWGSSLGLSYIPLGGWGLPVALLIALLKATLVVAFFMELVRERASMIYAFVTGVFMLLLLMAFVALDVVTRAPSAGPTSNGLSQLERNIALERKVES